MKAHPKLVLAVFVIGGLLAAVGATYFSPAHAQTPPPGPQSSTVGVEGIIPSDPPTEAATVSTPSNAQVFTTIPISVSGLCPDNTLVKVFSNEIFVGSVPCINGSYSVDVSLFSGRNDLISRVFDSLDQQGPDSRVITVFYEDSQSVQFGSHVLLTSQYARRAASPGQPIDWPIIVSNGIGPYALSVDWGDDTPAELRSEPFAGTISFKHTYKNPGVYRITFKVADRNGTTGYLQVVAVATGTIATNGTSKDEIQKTIVTKREILWWPMAILLIPAVLTFWLGRKFEIVRLRKRLEQDF